MVSVVPLARLYRGGKLRHREGNRLNTRATGQARSEQGPQMFVVWWLPCFVSASGLSHNLGVRPGEDFKKAAFGFFGGFSLGNTVLGISALLEGSVFWSGHKPTC